MAEEVSPRVDGERAGARLDRGLDIKCTDTFEGQCRNFSCATVIKRIADPSCQVKFMGILQWALIHFESKCQNFCFFCAFAISEVDFQRPLAVMREGAVTGLPRLRADSCLSQAALQQ